MSLGARLQKTAAKLIDKHGDNVTITMRAAAPVRDAAKPWRGSTGTVTTSVKAIQYPYEEEEMPDATTRQGSSRFIIAENDTAGTSQFSAVDLTTATDLEEADGGVWSINLIEIIEPGAERILYLAHTER